MQTAIEFIHAKARHELQTIVLPEGRDPRTIKAAAIIARERLARTTIVGNANEVRALARRQDVVLDDSVDIVDPATSPLTEEFIQAYVDMRKAKKPVSADEARATVTDELGFGAMLVRTGRCAGFVSGADHTTADVCRAAFRIIGISPEVKIGSSFSLMQLPAGSPFGVRGALLYADTGTVPNPNADQLADIAVATARSAQALLGVRPRVAMISFSTKGSASDPSLEKVIRATEIARENLKKLGLDADVDGEMQADAALIPSIGKKKAPGSPVAGEANVLVFPDLNCGNTCYKLTERLAGAAAYGPVLQGLNHPASDLSRGCSAEDIVGITAIVACQAIGRKQAK